MNIIFFDGVCNLCNHFINALVTLGLPPHMKIASLQGETARNHLKGVDLSQLKSVYYSREGDIYKESAAVIRILADLKWYFRVLLVLLVIPDFLRDEVYRFISRHRYRLFGKKETCRLPLPHEKDYFLN